MAGTSAAASFPVSAPEPEARVRSGFIAGPVADSFFLIAAPLVALLVWLPFTASPVFDFPFADRRFGRSVSDGFITVVIFSHLFLVFFRSHLNGQIFRLYPGRFIAVPILLFGAMLTSHWILVAMGVLAVWWDVYHSSLQTFGIGRIYDMRAGNDLVAGRRIDWIWNLVMYAGPVIAGATLMDHMQKFDDFSQVDSVFFTKIPAYASSYSRFLTWGVLAFGVPFSVYYVYRYAMLARQGYRVSFQKLALYLILGFVSIFCWGFNSFGEAFFVMNFFHALQYFFLVWHTEGDNITTRFGLGGLATGRYLALAIFVSIGICFGLWSTQIWSDFHPPSRIYMSTLLLVSILHFWYDGFIWSVQRGQVR